MSLSMRIAPHLPYLRRFSRAVTGSQTSGDAYVAATLEALIADTSIFPDATNDKIALYRLFSALFSSSAISIPEPASTFAWEQRRGPLDEGRRQREVARQGGGEFPPGREQGVQPPHRLGHALHEPAFPDAVRAEHDPAGRGGPQQAAEHHGGERQVLQPAPWRAGPSEVPVRCL